MILPATATLATASHCSAVETSPSMPGPSNKCDFGASEPMPQQPQQRSALTTLPTAPAAGTGKSFNWVALSLELRRRTFVIDFRFRVFPWNRSAKPERASIEPVRRKKNPEWYYLKEKKKKIRRISQMNTHFFFATIYDEQTNLSDAIKSCRSLFFSICIRYISISVGCYIG